MFTRYAMDQVYMCVKRGTRGEGGGGRRGMGWGDAVEVEVEQGERGIWGDGDWKWRLA